jgi:tetratricopeptide (TPR) repeat protein
VADPTAEARIRDLERRLDLDSGSRLFVSLAEEYRKVGRIKDALSALQKGLLAHPGYIAAQVALGRAYLEANQATDAIATFTKVLAADPANLVAAKSLADIHLSRRDNLEALKKYKLYRAISGDRKIDAIIAELEPLVAPKPPPPPRIPPPAEPLPPPPRFQDTDKGRRRTGPRMPPSQPSPPLADAFEMTSLSFEAGDDSGKAKVDDPFPFIPTRDVALGPDTRESVSLGGPLAPPAPPAAAWEPSPVLVPAAPADAPTLAPPAPEPVRAPEPPPEPVRPTGRALADMYYAQGHYAEALQIYDDLVMRHPFDDELKRMRRDAEARLLPASTTSAAAQDAGLERRLARIRALKQWLSLVQAG